ncbi:hypothetical protein CTEN210_02854 [Chaetoceros tenuissimus]|uniref:Leucine-rich repeat domain-containing protein n=1 Tax=Chaetoceros tenuissimus TaxID=426638 RepID=A0AAD3CKL1_9STRA|nr:hypothetical protein CTEN210_02854 [Chaetoceros tenuissimus]
MRVATVDGLVTLFYDGSKQLYNEELSLEWVHGCIDNNYDCGTWEEWDLSEECKKYWRERQSWQQVIVVEGVTEIQERTFRDCRNIKRVIFANTVIRIERSAFNGCSLGYVKLSTNLEYIGSNAFTNCDLVSVFIPPRCRAIGEHAFRYNHNLKIFSVPQQAQLDKNIIAKTKLLEKSHFEMYEYDHHTGDVHSFLKEGDYDDQTDKVHD